ncbi:hypothetical protein E2C01_089437 [Portunus trituberculatus]|uniref:Uncharacterized protein n=1 Tax=Portunus trituberculatus TaxID=210409 RepID=A0A5B7JI68_PORTR|nr:hypothetical protein [Portunus trituberculatus]
MHSAVSVAPIAINLRRHNYHLSSTNIDLRAASLLSIDLGRRGTRGRVAGGAAQYRPAQGTAR